MAFAQDQLLASLHDGHRFKKGLLIIVNAIMCLIIIVVVTGLLNHHSISIGYYSVFFVGWIASWMSGAIQFVENRRIISSLLKLHALQARKGPISLDYSLLIHWIGLISLFSSVRTADNTPDNLMTYSIVTGILLLPFSFVFSISIKRQSLLIRRIESEENIEDNNNNAS